MNKALGIALIVAGVLLVIFGINASDSVGSDVSRALTGTPTDKSIWLLVSGIVSAIDGAFLTFSGKSLMR